MCAYRWIVAGVVLAAGATVARSDEYSKWVKDEKQQTYTCEYTYKTKDGKDGKQPVVIYYADADRSGWAYFYNAKREPWARCAAPGNPKYDARVMYWEALTPDAKGYDRFKDKDGKYEPAGYCPAPKDGKSAIPPLPLPPK